jgi:hypothetical protein
VSLQGAWPALVSAGYVLSTAAVVMHFWEIAGNGAALHQTALLVITVGFLALAAVAGAAPALRKRRGGIRVLASMCLALFAMSFVHFGSGHASQAWSSELVVHHAGIPLALFVLLQDYRFVLLDAFVRFLANALLAAVHTVLVIAAADLHAPVLANVLPASRLSPKWNWAEVVVPVRRGQGDVQLILLGRRQGGQRYFSEDLDTLARTALEIAERVETLRRQEMSRLVSQAELRALQSQN